MQDENYNGRHDAFRNQHHACWISKKSSMDDMGGLLRIEEYIRCWEWGIVQPKVVVDGQHVWWANCTFNIYMNDCHEMQGIEFGARITYTRPVDDMTPAKILDWHVELPEGFWETSFAKHWNEDQWRKGFCGAVASDWGVSC
jgi:hypothetical protein